MKSLNASWRTQYGFYSLFSTKRSYKHYPRMLCINNIRNWAGCPTHNQLIATRRRFNRLSSLTALSVLSRTRKSHTDSFNVSNIPLQTSTGIPYIFCPMRLNATCSSKTNFRPSSSQRLFSWLQCQCLPTLII